MRFEYCAQTSRVRDKVPVGGDVIVTVYTHFIYLSGDVVRNNSSTLIIYFILNAIRLLQY